MHHFRQMIMIMNGNMVSNDTMFTNTLKSVTSNLIVFYYSDIYLLVILGNDQQTHWWRFAMIGGHQQSLSTMLNRMAKMVDNIVDIIDRIMTIITIFANVNIHIDDVHLNNIKLLMI